LLQHQLIQRIERVYRLRLVYSLHLALFGLILVGVALVDSAYWQNAFLMALLWLPVIVGHTAAQSFIELRERCVSYAPAPIQPFNYQALPVDVYDEQGNIIDGDRNGVSASLAMRRLPKPTGILGETHESL
jgi:hypothetical protein